MKFYFCIIFPYTIQILYEFHRFKLISATFECIKDISLENKAYVLCVTFIISLPSKAVVYFKECLLVHPNFLSAIFLTVENIFSETHAFHL